MKKIIETSVKALDSKTEYSIIEEELNLLLGKIISSIGNATNLQPINPIRRFRIEPLEMKHGVSIGSTREGNEIKIADWFVKTKRTRPFTYLLYFLLVKESLLHFLKSEIGEIEEAFVNIIAFLWLKETFKIRSKGNSMYKAITAQIYTGSMDGVSYAHFSFFLSHLFIKKKTFKDVLEIYKKSTEEKSLQGKELFTELQNWRFSLFSELDIIAPFHLNEHLLKTINLLLELGFENANVQTIAKRLNVHPNSIRNNYRTMLREYSTFWKANINLDKLKLHRYFLKIVVDDSNTFDKLTKIVWDKLPYNDRLFFGEMENSNKIIYSPTLFCPHLVSENLNTLLLKLLNNGEIVDYSLREIREKVHYGTITTVPINPTIKYFKKILHSEKQKKNLYTLTFSHLKENLSVDIEDKTKHLDYNLLYFLSIIQNRPLLKSGRILRVRALPKLFQLNNIALTDTIAQTDFLNQIEIRAKRRGLISYTFSLVPSMLFRQVDSTIFEIPTLNNQNEEKLTTTMNQLQKFSIFGKIVLSNKVIGLISGISHNHPISKMIKKILIKNEFEPTVYTVRLNEIRPYQFHDLYDYVEKKWLLKLHT